MQQQAPEVPAGRSAAPDSAAHLLINLRNGKHQGLALEQK